MDAEILRLKQQAEQGRYLYRTGQVSKAEAVAMIQPYADVFDAKSKELAKKYNQRPKTFSLSAFLR